MPGKWEAAGSRVLVVDDDEAVRSLLTRYLTLDGFVVQEATDGPSALQAVASTRPDLMVLDVGLGASDGLDVLETLRRTADVPVILLTSRGTENDRVLGLKLGADDYVVKPFSPAELSLRISSILRRARPASAEPKVEFEGLVIDKVTREVFVRGEPVPTTAKEFDLLAFLAGSPRQVFSREQLLSHVWQSNTDWQDPATVTEHIRRLRYKIEADPDHPNRIVTVRGVGYRFEP